jgi:hypothetical protein
MPTFVNYNTYIEIYKEYNKHNCISVYVAMYRYMIFMLENNMNENKNALVRALNNHDIR